VEIADAKLVHQGLALVVVDVGYHDVDAGRVQATDRGLAHAAGAAGHDRRGSRELHPGLPNLASDTLFKRE
jgi:hypothetical protein